MRLPIALLAAALLAASPAAAYVVIEMERLMVSSVQPAPLERDDALFVALSPVDCPADAGRRTGESDGACVAVDATLVRADGTTEHIDRDGVDDLGIWVAPDEAICLGSDDCDDLLWICENDSGCEFTCHVALPDEGQACIFGSTD